LKNTPKKNQKGKNGNKSFKSPVSDEYRIEDSMIGENGNLSARIKKIRNFEVKLFKQSKVFNQE
jgi:hypothetical protein